MTKKEHLLEELRKAISEGNRNERVIPIVKAIFIENGIEPEDDHYVPYEPPTHE